MSKVSRRDFFRRSATLGMTAALAGPLAELCCSADERGKADGCTSACAPISGARTGTCRRSWPTAGRAACSAWNCGPSTSTASSRHLGSPRQRTEVKKRFAASPVVFVGTGTNECFDNPDPARLRQSIEAAKKFVRLSHDCGGSGVKVKPNDFHKGVPRERARSSKSALRSMGWPASPPISASKFAGGSPRLLLRAHDHPRDHGRGRSSERRRVLEQ